MIERECCHLWSLVALVTVFGVQIAVGQQPQFPYACDSMVYCVPGEHSLLHTVQMALPKLYPDSKTFVDKPMRFPEETVLSNFRQMMKETGNNPPRNRVKKFVDENFDEEGTEFTDWDPTDWKEDPAFLDNIQDENYRELASDLNERWKELGRQIKPELEGSDTTSLIYLEKPFIVPGGRFREMYYWDSYWTILGLMRCEMTETVKGMLENFAYLVDTLGHVPNGNRIYYERRSQPPLFISMVDAYYRVTKDKTFLRSYINAMDKEFRFWMENRMENKTEGGRVYKVAVYNVQVDGPRPESYREDYRDAQSFSTPSQQTDFYMNMKSGAESGWDYSTKWFVGPNGEPSMELTDVKTRRIVPVELNSYLCKSAKLMREYYEILGDANKEAEYEQYANDIRDAIDTLLWNDELGSWFDYDLINEKQRLSFYASTVGPLWADCYTDTRARQKSRQVVKYLQTTGALNFIGGVPTSMIESGQQWDLSNAWAPLQELLVTALENAGTDEAKDLAFDIAEKWIYQMWASYEENEVMYEKYNVTKVGPGAGGEYDVQDGFGWTNGVYLEFIARYGDRVSTTSPPSSSAGVINLHLTWMVGVVVIVYLLMAH